MTENKSIVELVFELIELTEHYLKQEAENLVRDSIVEPVKRVGAWLAIIIIAAMSISLGVIFLSIGLFQLLAEIVGAAWIAYLIIGILPILIAGILISAGGRLIK